MARRLSVNKTFKLYIGGKFPRSESGRSLAVVDSEGRIVAHTCRASRKDLREAVEAARGARAGWAGATAYLRGQILYRMAEMLEGKAEEFADVIAAGLRVVGEEGGGGDRRRREEGGRAAARREVRAAIDRLVSFAGWTDKYAQVLGCQNPVAGPYYNFTVPQPTGVVAAIAPEDPPLLGLVSLIAPALCAGNTVVALGSEANPLTTSLLAEVCATSDVPGGVVNLLTGLRGELLEHIASHREINAIGAAGLSADEGSMVQRLAADSVKRVLLLDGGDWFDADAWEHPWMVEPLIEMKTIWHPSAT